jgi:cation diffusion facilitator CzcD-associated flavoprotein CzcO
MSAPGVIVIGAGPAGLAAAAAVGHQGIPATVLEQADSAAASWLGRYDRLRLNTCRWTSQLPRSRYPSHTGLFPSRDEVISYLKDYVQRHALDIRVRTCVERIDRRDGGWQLQTSAGPVAARHVIVATGHDHTPHIPPWPGRERYAGCLVHAAAYRNAQPFRHARVVVAGAGCSGLEIAYDLAEGGAGRVWVAIRTQPNMMLRQSGGLPGDLPAIASLRLPARIADSQARLVRRLTIGDLSQYGLTPPAEGIFTRLRRDGTAPAIVDKDIIHAIRTRRIETTASIQSLEQASLVLVGGTRIQADAIIAATGYTPGLESLAGHLGVLDQRGLPHTHGGKAAAPGLRFIGYLPRPGQIGHIGREAQRAARAIKNEPRPLAQGSKEQPMSETHIGTALPGTGRPVTDRAWVRWAVAAAVTGMLSWSSEWR